MSYFGPENISMDTFIGLLVEEVYEVNKKGYVPLYTLLNYVSQSKILI